MVTQVLCPMSLLSSGAILGGGKNRGDPGVLAAKVARCARSASTPPNTLAPAWAGCLIVTPPLVHQVLSTVGVVECLPWQHIRTVASVLHHTFHIPSLLRNNRRAQRPPGRFLVDKSTIAVCCPPTAVLYPRWLPSTRRPLPFKRGRFPSNRRWLPSNRRWLPSNRRRLPSSSCKLLCNCRVIVRLSIELATGRPDFFFY